MTDWPTRTTEVHAALGEARAHVHEREPATLASQIALSEIAAPTGEEHERAAWVAQQFAALRLGAVRTDEAGNVIGTRRGRSNEAPLVLLAHLDTVFPRRAISRARRDGDRVYVPGIGDNGRGLAVLLALAHLIDGTRLSTHRDIRFVATTGEEGPGDLRGAKHYFASDGAAIGAIAIDGTGDDRIVHQAVGSRRLRVSFEGPGGHSWSDFGNVNAIHASATAIARVAAMKLQDQPRVTLTVARTGGGMAINAIPESAWFEVDIRSTTEQSVHDAERALRTIVAEAVDDANARRPSPSAALHARIDVFGNRPCGTLAEDAPLVRIAAAATELVGVKPELATASTDANVPLSLGIPAIAIGGGGVGGDVHTLGEWYENTEGARGIARALTIVVAAAS